MRWILLAMAFLIFVSCARLNSVGWVDLPDGSRLKAIQYQSDTVIGTDINYVLIYHCPAQELGLKCEKAGEFGGSTPSFPKALFGNAAAAAAIGAGIALQDYKGDRVNVEGSKQQQGQKQFQKQGQRQHQHQQQSGPMMMGGGGD